MTLHNKIFTIEASKWSKMLEKLPRKSTKYNLDISNFWESRMRMRVLREKLRVENENESSEGKNEIEIENETLNFQEWASD